MICGQRRILHEIHQGKIFLFLETEVQTFVTNPYASCNNAESHHSGQPKLKKAHKAAYASLLLFK